MITVSVRDPAPLRADRAQSEECSFLLSIW